MRLKFTPFLFILILLSVSSFHRVAGQTVQVSLGPDTTLPCNVSCTNLTASLTQVLSTTNYSLDSSISFASHPSFTAGTAVTFSYADDGFSPAIPLPFNFCFYGVTYSSLVIGTNGEITFNTANASGASGYSIFGGIPTYSYHPPSILPAYHDLLYSSGGTCRYNTVGIAPNRQFVISYYQVPHFGTSCSGYSSTFQVVLYETTNNIDFYIQDKPACTSWQGGLAISGLQNNTTQAIALPGKNGTVWGSTGMNKAYRFTPSGTSGITVQLLNSVGTVMASTTSTPSANPAIATATFTNICLTTDSANFIAKVIYSCNSGTIYDTIKVKRLIVPKPTVVSPVTYCQGATAAQLTATGQNLLWYTTLIGGIGSAVAPTPSTAVAGTQTFYVSQTINGCESARDSIVVNVIGATSPVASSNSPVCQGATINLSASTVTGATYSWTGPNGFTSNLQNPSVTNAQAANSGTYTVTATVNGCTSSGGTTTVVVNPNPVITSITFTDPTSCGGTNGTISLNGLSPNTSYTVNYSFAGNPQPALSLVSSAAGTVTITGLGAGTYSLITVTINGCTSASTGPVTLNNPSAPSAPVAGSNSPVCVGQTLNLTASSTAGGTYSWTGPNAFTSSLQNPTITNVQLVNSGTYQVTVTLNGCVSTAGTVTVIVNPIPAAPAAGSNSPVCAGSTLNLSSSTSTGGTYSWTGPNGFTSSVQNPTISNITSAGAGTYSVSVTVNGCTSATGSTAVTVNPLPVIASISSTNPTVCAGTNGTITINGLTANTSYSISYSKNGTPQSPVTLTSSSTGTVTITGLSAGTYSNIVVTVNGCNSLPAGPVSLSDPNPPAPPVASSNSPICQGATLNLFATTIAGASYNWSGPGGFTSALQNPSVVNAQLTNAGTYSVSVTVNNCTSTAATTSVVINPLPVISGITSTNPTTCNGNNGTITISGLTNNTTYSVSFSKNGIPQPSVSILSSGTGTLIITGLTAGTYSNIIITINGCSSAAAGPVTLNDPAAPSAPTISNNGPLCQGTTLNLTASAVTGGIYSWTGPNSFTSTSQNPSIPNVQLVNAGTYSVTVTVNNCTSVPSTTTVVVNPQPSISNISFVNPTTCGGTNGSIILSGLQPNTSYAINYIFNSSSVGPVNITSSSTGTVTIAGLSAGTYSNITVTINGCSSSSAGPVTLVNPAPPATPVVFSNSPVCQGASINLSTTSLAGATYSWTGPNGFTSGVQNPTITNAQAINAGTYSLVVTTNNCPSPAGTSTVTVNSTPVISSTSFINPTGCNGTNGSISLNGLTSNASYTVSYTKNGVAQTPLTIVSSASGVVLIPNLSAGNYTNISVTINGCTSNIISQIILNDPGNPTPPIVSNNGPLCTGATLNLAASTVAGATYSWTGPGGFTSSLQNPSITNVTTGNAGVYSVTVTLNNCVSNPATTTVVINVTPANPIVGSNSPVCSGNAINLTSTAVAGATYSWTGPNSFTSALQNPVIANAQAINSGTYTLVVSLNNCSSSPTSTTVVVNPTPVISSSSFTNPTGCNGTNGSITLSGLTTNATYIVNYTKNGTAQPGVTLTSSATGTVVLSNLSAGTYTNITVTINGCVSNIISQVILTDPGSPAAPTVSNNGPLCAGATLNLTSSAVAGATYSWTGPGGFSSALQNPSITNVTTTNAGVYSVTVTLNNCTSNPSSTTVIINPAPATPTVSSNSPLCEGSSLTLTAVSGAGATYSWTGPNSFTSSLQNPTITNAQSNASGTYTVTATINGCTSAAANVTVTISPVPAAPIVSNITYCQGATASLLTATGQNLLWYINQTGPALGATPTPSTATPGTFTWYVSQTINGCESPKAALTVTVTPKPAMPSVTASYNYCQFETSTQLSATGQNIQWYTVATGGTAFTTAPTPSTATVGVFNWYVSQTINGCESDRAVITVTVNPKPGLPSVVSPVLYCKNDIASALTAGGQNLLWYATASGGTGSSTSPVPVTSSTGSTTYYVSQTVNGCESDRAAITVTVGDNVFASISVDRNNICQFDTITVSSTAANPPTANYQWSFDGGTIVSGVNPGPFDITWNTPGLKSIVLTVTDGNCIARDTQQVNVKASPDASFVLKDDACVDEQISVQAAWNAITPATYTWDFGGANVLSGSGAGAYKLIWINAGTYVLSLQITENGCKSPAVFDTINIHDQPVAKINLMTTGDLCIGSPIKLSAVPVTAGEYSYFWTPIDFFNINGLQETEVKVKAAGFIYLQTSDKYGCTGFDSLFIDAKGCCNIMLPDAFTPNGDSRNDFFGPISKADQQLAEFRIVNRWGQVVFQTADFHEKWDGTYKGIPQEIGTYYYYLRYRCGNGEDFEKKGEITLIR
jgi:gliding motility-associated-like protein